MILNSEAFKTWWSARKSMGNVPKDPYRAFMIDLSLMAKLKDKKKWKPMPNRSDLLLVDFPRSPKYIPAKKPKIPSRKSKSKSKKKLPIKSIKVKPSEIRKLLLSKAEEMAQKYHVPIPRIIISKPLLHSHYKSSYLRSSRYPAKEPTIVIGAKGIPLTEGGKAQILAVFTHEFGHHVHAYSEYYKTGKISLDYIQKARRIEAERTAWKIADPFLQDKRALQKWFKRFAMETYLKHGKVKITKK
ncbi:MAG: hypothetical protein ACTSSG_14055 [Candidatus Heimdallarchaeaceae archaeon]